MLNHRGLVECVYSGCKTLLAGKRKSQLLCMKHENLLLEISQKKKGIVTTPSVWPPLPAPKSNPPPPTPPASSSSGEPGANVRSGGLIRRGHRKLIEELKRKIAGRARDDDSESKIPK